MIFFQTLEAWEDGFRQDQHVEREIALWFHIAALYKRCIADKETSFQQRNDYFNALLSCTFGPRERIFESSSPRPFQKRKRKMRSRFSLPINSERYGRAAGEMLLFTFASFLRTQNRLPLPLRNELISPAKSQPILPGSLRFLPTSSRGSGDPCSCGRGHCSAGFSGR
jgi:hypothetical protein